MKIMPDYAKGTTTFTGLAGHSCVVAGEPGSTNIAAASERSCEYRDIEKRNISIRNI